MPMKIKTATLAAIVAAAAVFAVWFACSPPDCMAGDVSSYRECLVLQHTGTAMIALLLAWDVFRGGMPLSAFFGVSAFTLLHIIGACYLYSYVPYAEWFAKLGIVVETAGVHANKFDRFVHFSFGLLLFPYLLYKCRGWFGYGRLRSILAAWLIVQTGSMIYELFEWQLAVFMSPEDAEYYNGQQGDAWDAQKDMALAMLGSTLAAAFCACTDWRRAGKPNG